MVDQLQTSTVSDLPDYYQEVVKFRDHGFQFNSRVVSCQKFVPNKDELNAVYNTPLTNLLSKRQLPFAVKLKRNFNVCGDNRDPYDINLKAGSTLMLHFIVRPERIFATYKREDIVLPIHAEQLYEVLPMDSAHDDKIFHGTTEVIRSNPLPTRLRITDAMYSDAPGERQEKGEIVEVSHVEKHGSIKVLVGRRTVTQQNFAFPEHMKKSTYSTMISEENLTLSSVIRKFKLPLRVRKVDQKKFEYILNEVRREAQVICTAPLDSRVFALTLTCPVQIDCIDKSDVDEIFKATLPPLYPLLNLTWGVKEIGRAPLPIQQRQTPQPLLGVLCHWLNSKDGSKLVSMISGSSSETKSAKSLAFERKKKDLERRLSPCPSIPPKPSTVTNSDRPMPAVPPKPLERKPLPDRRSMAYETILPTPASRPKSQLHAELEKKQKEIEKLQKERQILTVNLNKYQTENRALQAKVSELLTEISRLKKGNYVASMNVHSRSDTLYEVPEHGGLANESVEDILKVLDEIGLSAYLEKFRKEKIDGALLCDLITDGEEIFLTELKMKRLHARKLVVEIKKRL